MPTETLVAQKAPELADLITEALLLLQPLPPNPERIKVGRGLMEVLQQVESWVQDGCYGTQFP